MTDNEFCRLDSEFYGEKVDNINQISLRSFNGKELKEYVEHFNARTILINFFTYFRDNGEKHIGMSIEQFVDEFLKTR